MNNFGILLFAINVGTSVTDSVSIKDKLEWISWKVKYSRNYESNELERAHHEIWQRNKVIVEEHNSKTDASFKMELNNFADQDIQNRPLVQLRRSNVIRKPRNALQFTPSAWDWRQQGAISAVHNQGKISDSISIVAEECVESYHFLHNKGTSLLRLSEEEVYDCCARAPVIQPDVFECIHHIGGLCKEVDYKPSSTSCNNASCTAAAQIDGSAPVLKDDEDDLRQKVFKTPVLAVINAGLTSFQLYQGGVYDDSLCTSSTLDHAVQVVGYGYDTHSQKDYWICKNSWGRFWGEQGYIRIARNRGNVCGIASAALYPI